MNYYVHYNSKKKKARVHLGSCKYCKQGKGIPHFSQLSDEKWHGPYETLESAKELAKTLQVTDTRACAHCLDGRRF